jgi:hypothetical protein
MDPFLAHNVSKAGMSALSLLLQLLVQTSPRHPVWTLNYSTTTPPRQHPLYQRMSRTRNSWVRNSSSFAMQNDYLLHCILGLSAFHMANQHGKTESSQLIGLSYSKDIYLRAAYSHHEGALKGYRQCLSTLNQDTYHASFGCACLLFITSFARPPESDDKPNQPYYPAHIWLGYPLSE